MEQPKIVKAKVVIEVEAEVMLDRDGLVEEIRDIREVTDIIRLTKLIDIISTF
jgi:hypothetical protein